MAEKSPGFSSDLIIRYLILSSSSTSMSSDERTPLLNGDQENIRESSPNETAGTSRTDVVAPKVNVIALLGSSTGGILLAALDSTLVTTSFARIGSDMNQLQRASWIATSYMMGITAFQPLYGKLSDIFGRKPCILFAHFAFGIGCLACALANSLPSLVAARLVSGIGGAGLLTIVTVSVSDIVPLRERGTWQAIINLIYSVGTGVGAPLGGYLIDNYGWRQGFMLQVPICILGFIAILFIFPNIKIKNKNGEEQEETALTKLRRVDFLGSIFLIITVFSLLLGLDYGSNIAWTSPVSYISLIVSVVGLIGLVIIESKPSLAKEPVMPLKFFQNRNIVAFFLTSFSLLSVGSSTVFQLAFYAQVLSRKSASQAGVYLVPVVISLVSGNLLGGILLQKKGKFRNITILAHIGAFTFAFLGVVFTYLRPSWVLIGITTSMSILSFFAGISSTTLLVGLIASVDSSDQASATAVSFLFRTMGSTVGLSVSSAILQQVIRLVLTRDLSGSQYDVDEIVRRARESLSYIDSLEPALQRLVRNSYGQGLLGAFAFGVFQCGSSLLTALFIQDRSLDSSK